jgi:hypothetical protein
MMETWREKHPDWSHHVWTEENIDYPLLNQAQFDAMKNCGGKADVLRYEILNRHGGIYVDADMTCLKPLDPSFLEAGLFAAYENERRRPGLIANGMIGCTAGHPVMQKIIERIHRLDPGRLGDADASIVTGPYAFTKVIEAYRIGLSPLGAPRSGEIIDTVLGDLPGDVLEIDGTRPGVAWNDVLTAAGGVAEYSLMAEPDTILYDFRRNMIRRNLDCYEINEHGAGVKRRVPAMVRADGRWRCSDSTPSSVSRTEPGEKQTLLECCHLRRLDPSPVDLSRHLDEQALLLEELERRPDEPEPLFYLGQYFEDTGDPSRAIHYYEQRVEAGGWTHQAWEASMRIARCLRMAEAEWPAVETALMNAHHMDPTRPDPLVELGSEARRRGDHDQAADYLAQATSLATSEEYFYWDPWVRQLALEHLCVSGYYAGRYAEGLRAGLEALQGESAGMGRDQIITNIGFYLDKVDIRSLDEK